MSMSSATDGIREAAHSPFSVLLTTSLVSSLIMLDSNIVAISLPTIGRSLAASFTDIQWVISAYILTYAALLLAAGNYADLHGRKKTMLIGLSIFALASAICGLATSVLMLNLARAAQGIGGALLLTASLAIISHDFSGAERIQAFAFWGANLGIALAAGPILGGAITNFVSWRWIFFINLPACAGLIIATLKIIAESHDPDAKQLDLPGILTFSSGLGLTIWALIDGNDVGWTSRDILLRLMAAAVLFIAFVRLELRQTRPMVDFTLFGRSTFLGSVLAMIGYGASAQVMVFFLPLFLQNSYGFEPLIAGLAMIPFALPMVLAPRVTRQLSSHFSGRMLLTAGLVITGIGNLLFWITARSEMPYPVFAVSMLVAGGGAGLLNGTTVKVLGSAVPPDRAGMASGLASTTRFIGILLAVAGLGAVLSDTVRDIFVKAAATAGLSSEVSEAAAKRVASGELAGMLHTIPDRLRAHLHDVGLMAFADGFSAAALLAAAIAAVACILTFAFVRSDDTTPVPLTKEERPCKTIDCRDPL